MGAISLERSRWFARQILPHETILRAWLGRKQVADLDVDDIIQETYAILATKETVDDIRHPKAYLFQVAYSVIVRHIQRSKIVPMRAMSDLERLDQAADTISPEQIVIDRDELHHLAQAIAAMPGKTQEAFILRRIQGLSQREIAKRLGVSENTVEKHIAKGIRLLINRFGRGGNSGLGASKRAEQGVHGVNVRTRDQSGH